MTSTDNNSNSGASDNTASASGDRSTSSRYTWVDLAIYLTRLGIIFSCLTYFIAPLFGGGNVAAAWYQRAMLFSAATSALRQHQRIGDMCANGMSFSLSKESIMRLLADDPFHYLVYSILFVFVSPITVAMVPIFLFALLHVVNFTQNLCQMFGINLGISGDRQSVSALHRILGNAIIKVRSNQVQILRLIAVNEIMLMGVTILMVFSGSHSFLLPLVYFRFLKLRYKSTRNQYSSVTFYELRQALQQAATHPSCPRLVTNIIYGGISLVCRLGS